MSNPENNTTTAANNITTAAAITLNSNTILHVNLSSVARLTSTTYLMWSLQVHAILDGYDLAGHLDGSRPPAPPTITVDNVVSENPDFARWRRQDKLIYGALIGAVSTSLQPTVSRTTTARQVWEKLASTYAKPSRGHIKQLKDQLKVLTKGTKTIDAYLQDVVAKLDQLALLGKPMDHEDQVELILDGLPDDYKPVVDQIAAKDTPPTITDIHERLLNQESKLLAAATVMPSVTPVSANAVQHRPQGNNYNRGNYNNHMRPNTTTYGSIMPNQSQQYQPHPENRPYKPYLGKCQLCNTQGHSVKRCPQFQAMMSPMPPPQTSPFRPWQPRANVAVASPYDATNWLLDSGATHHITSDLNNLSLHQPYTGGEDVITADGASLAITHTGSMLYPSKPRALSLDIILCIPDIKKNLISVYRLCNTNQVSVEFFPASFQVKDLSTGVPLLQSRTKNELYEWPVTPSQATAFFSSSGPKTNLKSWHSRLGHPSTSILNTIVSKFSLPVVSSSHKQLSCSDCLINKSHKLPFSQTSITSKRPLEILFSDVWMSPITSIDSYKYYLVIVDHFTRYTWMYPLKRKSDVKEVFIAFTALVQNRFETKITTLFSDNGGEFVALRDFLRQNGISHLTSPPHTPEHNGVSERKHRHIVETGLTLLTSASVPTTYWPYAFATAVYLINRMPTPLLSLESPYQLLFQQTPNYEKLRIFGCLCFPWLRPYNRHKLKERSQECVFIGYSSTQSAYHCLHVPSRRIYTSRHVQFEENVFPFEKEKLQIHTNKESELVSPAATTFAPHTEILMPRTGPLSSDLHRHLPSPPSPSNAKVLSPSNPVSSPLPNQNKPTAQQENGPQPSAQISLTANEPTAHTHTELQPSTQAQLPTNSQNPNQASPIIPNTTLTNTPSSSSQPVAPENSTTVTAPLPQASAPPQNIHKMQTRAKIQIVKPKKKFTISVSGPLISPEQAQFHKQ